MYSRRRMVCAGRQDIYLLLCVCVFRFVSAQGGGNCRHECPGTNSEGTYEDGSPASVSGGAGEQTWRRCEVGGNRKDILVPCMYLDGLIHSLYMIILIMFVVVLTAYVHTCFVQGSAVEALDESTIGGRHNSCTSCRRCWRCGCPDEGRVLCGYERL